MKIYLLAIFVDTIPNSNRALRDKTRLYTSFDVAKIKAEEHCAFWHETLKDNESLEFLWAVINEYDTEDEKSDNELKAPQVVWAYLKDKDGKYKSHEGEQLKDDSVWEQSRKYLR